MMFEEKQIDNINYDTSSVSNAENSDASSECNSLLKKKYSVISQENRIQFIKRVLSKQVTIKQAAREFNINFSTAKAILQTYKKEGRIGKKKHRIRKRSTTLTNGQTVQLDNHSQAKCNSYDSTAISSPTSIQNSSMQMLDKLPINFDELKCLLASQQENQAHQQQQQQQQSIEKVQSNTQVPSQFNSNQSIQVMEEVNGKTTNIYNSLLNRFFESNNNASQQQNLFNFQGSEINYLVENIVMLALKPEFNVTINKILKILHQECQSDHKQRQIPQSCTNFNFSTPQQNQMNASSQNSFLQNFQSQNQFNNLFNSSNAVSSTKPQPQAMTFNSNNFNNEAQLLSFLKENMQQNPQQQQFQNQINGPNKMLMEQLSNFMNQQQYQVKQEVKSQQQNQMSDFLLQLRSKLDVTKCEQ